MAVPSLMISADECFSDVKLFQQRPFLTSMPTLSPAPPQPHAAGPCARWPKQSGGYAVCSNGAFHGVSCNTALTITPSPQHAVLPAEPPIPALITAQCTPSQTTTNINTDINT